LIANNYHDKQHNLKNFILILNNLDIIGPFIALAAFFLRRKRITGELRGIFIFCLIQFVLNFTSTYLDLVFKANNYWVYKLNTILSVIVILIIFGKYLLPDIKKLTNWIILALIAINILSTFFGDGVTYYNSYSASLVSFVIVGYCLYYFYSKLLMSSPEDSVPSTPIFWCIVGLFTYFAGAFFIFISYKYMIEADIATIGTLWRFHNLLLVICCLYIGYGILCKTYQMT
jgi:hypothetical protein